MFCLNKISTNATTRRTLLTSRESQAGARGRKLELEEVESCSEAEDWSEVQIYQWAALGWLCDKIYES